MAKQISITVRENEARKEFIDIIDAANSDIDITVEILGENANFELFGIYYLKGSQKAKVRTSVIHKAANSRSRVNIKGVLEGESNFDWSGDVVIQPNAAGTDTYEENRNLILENGPKVVSIPNLEILTGEIVGAGHASTTGRIDDEQMFYLASRGISKRLAKKMLIEGFLQSQLDLINDDGVSQKFAKLIGGQNE